MARAGRKRKQGKRTQSGQLSRAGVQKYDKGTDRAQVMQALYGENWCDSIGRAFEAGLLGTRDDPRGTDAKAMLDFAREVHSVYWRAYAVGGFASCLGANEVRSGAGVVLLDTEREKRRERWLNAVMDDVNAMGVRRWFDNLVIDINPDSGPDWLDRIIYARRTQAVPAPSDMHKFQAAFDALENLAL